MERSDKNESDEFTEFIIGSFASDQSWKDNRREKSHKKRYKLSSITSITINDIHPRINCALKYRENEYLILKGRLWADSLYNKKVYIFNEKKDEFRETDKRIPFEVFGLNNKFMTGWTTDTIQILVTQDQDLFVRCQDSQKLLDIVIKVRVDFGFKRRYGSFTLLTTRYVQTDKSSIFCVTSEDKLVEILVVNENGKTIKKNSIIYEYNNHQESHIVNFCMSQDFLFCLVLGKGTRVIKLSRKSKEEICSLRIPHRNNSFPTAIGCDSRNILVCMGQQSDTEVLKEPRTSIVFLLDYSLKILSKILFYHTTISREIDSNERLEKEKDQANYTSTNSETINEQNRTFIRKRENISLENETEYQEINLSEKKMQAFSTADLKTTSPHGDLLNPEDRELPQLKYTRYENPTIEKSNVTQSEESKTIEKEDKKLHPFSISKRLYSIANKNEIKFEFEPQISEIFPLRFNGVSEGVSLFVLRGPEASFYLFSVVNGRNLDLIDAVGDGSYHDLCTAFSLESELGVLVVSTSCKITKYNISNL